MFPFEMLFGRSIVRSDQTLTIMHKIYRSSDSKDVSFISSFPLRHRWQRRHHRLYKHATDAINT